MSLKFRKRGGNNYDLVDSLKRDRVIESQKIEEAMLIADRGNFCKIHPYRNVSQNIGFGATIESPRVIAQVLEFLQDALIAGEKALDVGSGSGYVTVCMAHIIGDAGVVYGLEHIKSLHLNSIESIRKDCPSLLTKTRVRMICQDGRLGWEADAPYDVIHVGASVEEVPRPLLDQLKSGGQMLVPVGKPNELQILQKITKRSDMSLVWEPLMTVTYPPLSSVEEQWTESSMV